MKSNKLDNYLKYVALGLMYSYILILIMIAIIAWNNQEAFTYKENLPSTLIIFNGTELVQDNFTGTILSSKEIAAKKRMIQRIQLINFVCLIGWLWSVPEKRNRLKKVYKEISNKLKGPEDGKEKK